jgi:hypothetical protein
VNRANYMVVKETTDFILIRDLGPWDKHGTVTNDAERVVADLAPRLEGRRLLYYDSEDELDEILVENGQFAGFKVLREYL